MAIEFYINNLDCSDLFGRIYITEYKQYGIKLWRIGKHGKLMKELQALANNHLFARWQTRGEHIPVSVYLRSAQYSFAFSDSDLRLEPSRILISEHKRAVGGFVLPQEYADAVLRENTRVLIGQALRIPNRLLGCENDIVQAREIAYRAAQEGYQARIDVQQTNENEAEEHRQNLNTWFRYYFANGAGAPRIVRDDNAEE